MDKLSDTVTATTTTAAATPRRDDVEEYNLIMTLIESSDKPDESATPPSTQHCPPPTTVCMTGDGYTRARDLLVHSLVGLKNVSNIQKSEIVKMFLSQEALVGDDVTAEQLVQDISERVFMNATEHQDFLYRWGCVCKAHFNDDELTVAQRHLVEMIERGDIQPPPARAIEAVNPMHRQFTFISSK